MHPTPSYARTLADLPDAATLLSMSGMEFVEGMLAGRLKAPAIAESLNFRLIDAAPGRVTFVGTPGLAQTNPMGGVHGGWYGTVLDSAMGCAVMTTVPKGRWYTTLEYKINLMRALPLDREVEIVGEVDHAGRSTAVAHARITGRDDGKLYAIGSTTCAILGG